MEELSGLVERVTFHNEESGFCVLQVKAPLHKGLVPVTGHAPIVKPGEYLTAAGQWFNDKSYGRQFKAETVRLTPPSSVEGIERYLGSGMVKGIGPAYAKRMVDVFGERVLEVIEHSPAELLKVRGIGEGRMRIIAESWASQKVIKDIMLFLHTNGVSTSRATRIYKTYGDDAVTKVRTNPYGLAHDVRGIGFLSADQIAQNLGWGMDSRERIDAGIGHALWEATNDGHCGLQRKKLVEAACELLGVSEDLVSAGVDRELAEGRLVPEEDDRGRTVLYHPAMYATETGIAQNIARLVKAPRRMRAFDSRALYERIKGSLGMKLSEDQELALLSAGYAKFMVITGGPGCGKTSLENAILKMYAEAGAKMLLCAPTGRAAKRMSETTGRVASTIHRLLGFKPGGGATYNETNRLDCDLLVVDECSMVDVHLMHGLLKAVPDGASVLLVGDEDQLPSVGPGNVLGDIMASGAIRVCRLTKIFRQAAGSHIITGAHAINRGGEPEFSTKDRPGDFYFVERDEPEQVVAQVLDLVSTRLPARLGIDAKRDIQVISPMNKGVTGVRHLNERLQAILNPGDKPFVERFDTKYKVGDKVMQTENDVAKDVFNGDVGYIESIVEDEITIDFGGRSVVYDVSDLDQVQLAYAATVHKLQGSQAPAIVMAFTTQHYALLERKLLYTGVTRGQKMVVLVGQKKALKMAVENVNSVRRQTRLKAAIQAQFDVSEDI
ncbi:exodeoxyribonuclease V alpha subunit [Novimethylophilus kurashikiensis]|uniref:ATP-dependent RecD2 DNA helicase n=1 Tax=Novimethylophilus kurashikiensis TaxID=1825523 RepID=A0A2R5FE81_9PROT|nr:ATP-dependent RecD-like DNA helicase [Novimethylophilus kurashikiensis]GBG14861.1 exodeoxyribonuclease V alpha subunit [Novimethylophilus kurashikiensis]